MSYNIDNIEIIHQKDFGIDPTLYQTIKANIGDEIPETSIFDDNWNISKGIWWSGEFSGTSFGELKNVLAAFNGEADLVVTWERGGSFTGLRLRNHKVTEHKVVFALGEETK